MTPDAEHIRISSLLAEYEAGTLSALEQAAVKSHLAECQQCQHDLAEWQTIRAAAQSAAPQLEPSREVLPNVHARIAAEQPDQHRNPAFLFRLLCAQAPLVRPQIWAASALVMSLGVAVTFAFRQGADAFLAVIAPVVAAAGVGYIYGPDNDPPLEVVLSTPTSPRLILLARLALVFGYDFLLALGLSVVLALMGRASNGLWNLLLQWLGPMLLLSSVSLGLSLQMGSVAAVSVALMLWAARVTLSMNTNVLSANAAQTLALLGSTNVVTLIAAGVVLAVAVTLLPRLERFA